MHTTGKLWIGFLLIASWTAAVSARAPEPHDLSLLVIPQRVNLVHAGFELDQLRSVALVTYRTSRHTGELVLHGWTGQEWIPIALENYASGNFLLRNPVRIILVGDEALLPGALVEASNWGPLVLNVETTQTDEFFNAVGRLFEFTSREWRQIARRHNLTVEDVTPASARLSWYDQLTAAQQQPERRRVPPPDRRPPPAPLPVPTPTPQPTPPPPVFEPPPAFRIPPPQDTPPDVTPEALLDPIEMETDEDIDPIK